TGTITATMTTGGGPPQPADSPAVLTSGVRQGVSIGQLAVPVLFNGNRSYVIDVPASSTRLDVELSTATPGADLDLLVSYGRDNSVINGRLSADFSSDSPGGNERITLTSDTAPA